MRVTLLIAWREYLENVKTKGFWIGVLLVPIVFFIIFHVSSRLATATPTRYYLLVDQSGQYADSVESAIRREHQRRVMLDFMRYVQEHRIESNSIEISNEPSNQMDQLIENFSNDEVAALDDWLSKDGLAVALQMARPYLRADTPDFEEPRPKFVAALPPPGLDLNAPPEQIVETLRPFLNGEQRLQAGNNQVSLFALILIPADVDSDIVRPAPVPTAMPDDTTPRGLQYWAGNLTDTRLSNAIQTSINNAIRQQEYIERNMDIDVVRDVQRTRLPVSRLDPGKVAGEEQVSLADTFRMQ